MSRMPNFYRPPVGAPLRWQDDVSGELPRAVYIFLNQSGTITAEQIELVRDYMEYYINAPCWQTETMEQQFSELRQRVKTLRSAEEMSAWMHDALEIGIDPF